MYPTQKKLIGHQAAEQEMLAAFASGKLPNAWLISGAKGIGKATLAMRFAKFLLTNSVPSSQSDGLFGDTLAAEIPESLDVDESIPAIGRMLAGSHGDFMRIDTENLDDDKVRKEISVDEVRKINQFLSMTPSEASMRVVIVDSADEMNRQAANAILKILEEPPLNSILLMISHNPGKLLPTIRSRCRYIKLKSLSSSDMAQVMSEEIPGIGGEDLAFVSAVSEGSPGVAISLYNDGGLDIYQRIIDIFKVLPNQDIPAIDKLGEKLEGAKNKTNWDIASYLLQYFLASVVRTGINDNEPEIISGENALKSSLARQCSAAKWADLWERIGHMAAEADFANLDKKHAIITMFNTIRSEVA